MRDGGFNECKWMKMKMKIEESDCPIFEFEIR